MALLDRPSQPEDDNFKPGNNEAYISDLTMAQQFEYITTKRMLEKCSKEQLLEFALKLLSFHMRYKNTNNAVVNEWGMRGDPQK